MKQGPVTLIMIGVLALVVSLISSNKIVKEQTFKARRQALSIQNSQPKQRDRSNLKLKSLKRQRLGITGVSQP